MKIEITEETKFSIFSKEWIKEQELYVKPTTFSNYIFIIERHIIPKLGNYMMKDLTYDIIQEYHNEKIINGKLNNKGALKEKSVDDIMMVLNQLLANSFKYNYTKTFENVRKITNFYDNTIKVEKDVEIFTKEEITKLVEYLELNWNNSNLGILIVLTTGIRIGEICGLQWKKIDLDNKTITIDKTIYRTFDTRTKNTEILIGSPKSKNSYRTIPIPNKLVKILKIINPKNEEIYLISNSIDPMEPRAYRYKFHKVLKNANIKIKKFHTLRHTFATNCIKKKIDVKTVSSILGHSSVAITLDLYVHSNIEDKKEAIRKVNLLG